MGSKGDQVTVLYKIVNSVCDKGDPLYNAFRMARGQRGPTLAAVKQSCSALYGLNHLGPEGYHWRVCVEEKGGDGTFSWWDIQDENAVLPVKQATQYALSKFFAPPEAKASSVNSDPTATAKGALKSFGKAMSSAVSGTDHEHGPPASVIAFKLVDIVKMHDDFATKHHGRGGQMPVATPQQPPRPAASRPPSSARPASAHQQRQQPQRASAPARPGRQAAPPPRQNPRQPSENLMDFGDAPSSGARKLNHMNSSPAAFGGDSNDPHLTKAQKTQQKYQKQKQKQNLVWDEIEQRYVQAGTIEKKGSGVSAASAAASKKKEVGISLDPSNAVGKSAKVQDAVNKRVNDMRKSQQEALQQLRAVEDKKKKDEAAEDAARKKLEPKIKAWSEEYGKKKQLRALLATLHTILWPGAKWKPLSIGDMMQDAKVKRAYLKATLVVHPDKTHHLPADQRFLAKRIFDALSQAKKAFDEGK